MIVKVISSTYKYSRQLKYLLKWYSDLFQSNSIALGYLIQSLCYYGWLFTSRTSPTILKLFRARTLILPLHSPFAYMIKNFMITYKVPGTLLVHENLESDETDEK
jgi:hypothetical protein